MLVFSQSEHVMATKPITERQQYWLDHLKRAAASRESLVDYAQAHDLKAKDLYAWKTRLIELGHLRGSRKKSKFVSVFPNGSTSAATLVIPNGYRLELQGRVDRHWLAELVEVIRSAS
ncbi:MAG: hypothetical protein AAGF57_19450 [Pseudomonadota bacterium]